MGGTGYLGMHGGDKKLKKKDAALQRLGEVKASTDAAKTAEMESLQMRNAIAAGANVQGSEEEYSYETRIRLKAAKEAAKKAATEAKKAPGEDNVVEGVEEVDELLSAMLASS